MISTFLSVVVEINQYHTREQVVSFLDSFSKDLAGDLEDYEIILVDNRTLVDLDDLDLAPEFRRNCYVLKLARAVTPDHARFAGLEQSNGDFVLCTEVELGEQINLIREMVQEGIEGADMVYLRDRKSLLSGPSLRRRLFFAAIRLAGERQYNPRDRREFLLSRRALNWVVRDQTESVFLRETITSLGFETKVMEVNLPAPQRSPSATAAFSEAWNTLARSPRFLSGVAQFVILSFFIIIVLTSADALLVRLLERNIFGQPDTVVPGWTLLVLIISLGFMLCSGLLYIILRLNLIILSNIKQQPRYIIEHFGRI